MKLIRIFVLSLLTMLACASATAQTSPNSTPVKSSPAAAEAPESREQVITHLIGDVRASRALVETLRGENTSLASRLSTERAYSASVESSYASAQKVIAAQERALLHLEHAIKLHEQSVATLQDRERQLAKEVKKNRKRAIVAGLVAVGTLATRLLL